MKFFITGATGFIGSSLCHALIEGGHEVVALLRSEHKRSLLPNTGITLIKGDLSVFKHKINLPPCDVVIHLASKMGPPSDRWFKEQHSLHETQDLISGLMGQNWQPKRLLFSSSIAALGPTSETIPLDESAPFRPVEPYGVSKMEVEQYLQTVEAFPVTSFRPPPGFWS